VGRVSISAYGASACSTAASFDSVTLVENGLTIRAALFTLRSMPARIDLVAVERAALVVVVVATLAACGGSSNDPVAHVGDTAITSAQLQDAIDHFKNEADAEGRPFPESGTTAYHTVERQTLGLLVYRTELLQSADKLGVPVTNAEVQQRMSESREQEGDIAFARDTVRAQIAYEHIYGRVTAGATASGREAAMRKWLDRMKQTYTSTVTYEPGFEPSS
jgi:SurA-like N-terminal domain